MKGKTKYTINKGKFISSIAKISLIVIGMYYLISNIMYPEMYSTTLRKNLKYDLVKGNQMAIEYYNDRYVANGKYLFDDEYIVKDDYLNMATVVDFETTESGLYLYTNDGNGYYFER